MYKRRVMITSVCIVGLLLVSACAENPEGDIIANKNENAFEEALNTENTDIQEEIEHFEDSFQVEKDDLMVYVDADVISIKGDIPVVKVAPHSFTVEDAKRWVEVLFEGSPVYDAKHVMTKSEIEERILELKSWINNQDLLMKTYGTEENIEIAIEEFKDEIALWEEKYADAPDSWDNPEADYGFHPMTYYYDSAVDESSEEVQELSKTEQMKVMAFPGGEEAYLSVYNRTESDYLLHMMSFFYVMENQIIQKSQSMEMSEEEVVEFAQEWIDKLDIGEWEVARIEPLLSEEGSDYRIYFSPIYEGINSLLPDGEVDLRSEDLYAAHLYFTSLYLRICNGQLLSVELTSPMDVVEVENDNIKVLSFEEIYNAFKNYSVSGLQDDMEEKNVEKADSVTITQIEQKLFRAKVKDSDMEFRMVPVWVFYGIAETPSGYQTEKTELAVINAVDGSIIDPYLGY